MLPSLTDAVLNTTNTTRASHTVDKLIQAMKELLGNTYAFYIKAHGFHWNVEGPNFPQYHALFGTVYEEVYGSVDDMAEHIRQLDSYAPAGLAQFNQLATIADESSVPNAKGMLERLMRDNDFMLECIENAYDLAEKNKCHGLSNFLADRQAAHSKHRWQLKATLKSASA